MNNLVEYLDIDKAQKENPVRAALACIQPLELTLLSQLKNLERRLEDYKGNLSDYEAEVAKKIDSFMEIIGRRIHAVEVLPSKYPNLAKRYGYFDYQTALSWRDKKGFPRLAIYGPESGICCFKAKDDGWSWHAKSKMEAPRLPKSLRRCFQDVTKLLRKKADNKDRTIKLASRFTGLIPVETRQQIVAAKKDFGDDIFVLAEAQWKEKSTPNPDPIVIGFKHEHAWLITTFDLTSLEAEIVKGLSASFSKNSR